MAMFYKQIDATLLESAGASHPHAGHVLSGVHAIVQGFHEFDARHKVSSSVLSPTLVATKLQAFSADHAQLLHWLKEHRKCRAAQRMTRASAAAVVHQGGLQRCAHQAHWAQVVPRRAPARAHYGLLGDGH